MTNSNKIVDYLQVTDRAIDEIARKVLEKNDIFGIKIGIKTRGCSGMAYNIEYATNDNVTIYDELANLDKNKNKEKEKIKIYIDPKISLFLFNTILDFEEKKSKNGVVVESGFIFKNPNETGRCGCGESFYV